MPDGSRLNTKDTLRVLAKWLDVQNAKFASKYGLEQLVWAEEQNSSRSSFGGQVRGWFRHDIADGGKRKVCPHASSAIDHMKLVCNVDFYDDIKKERQHVQQLIFLSSFATRSVWVGITNVAL